MGQQRLLLGLEALSKSICRRGRPVIRRENRRELPVPSELASASPGRIDGNDQLVPFGERLA
jgi:hypothetical protein